MEKWYFLLLLIGFQYLLPAQSEIRNPNSEIDQDTLLLPEMTFYTDPSPVKTLVFSSAYLEKRGSPVNLIESIKLINGLPDAYTAVLIDGMPMYGNLAAVYGLNPNAPGPSQPTWATCTSGAKALGLCDFALRSDGVSYPSRRSILGLPGDCATVTGRGGETTPCHHTLQSFAIFSNLNVGR